MFRQKGVRVKYKSTSCIIFLPWRKIEEILTSLFLGKCWKVSSLRKSYRCKRLWSNGGRRCQYSAWQAFSDFAYLKFKTTHLHPAAPSLQHLLSTLKWIMENISIFFTSAVKLKIKRWVYTSVLCIKCLIFYPIQTSLKKLKRCDSCSFAANKFWPYFLLPQKFLIKCPKGQMPQAKSHKDHHGLG